MTLNDNCEVTGMIEGFDSFFWDDEHVIEIGFRINKAKLIDSKEGIFFYNIRMSDYLIDDAIIEEWLHVIEITVTIEWVLLELLNYFNLVSGGVVGEIKLSKLLGCNGLILRLSGLTEDYEGVNLIELGLAE